MPLVYRGRKRRFEGLTPEGQRILTWAQRILADRDALIDEVQAMRTGLSGELRIGTVPSASPAASIIVEPFCAKHPLVHAQVMSDLRSEDILQRLNDFDIDAGITYLDEHVARGFRTVPLYRERYVLLVEAAAGQARTGNATWAEAATLPLCLLTPAMQGRRVLDEAFAEAGVEAAPRAETDSVASLFANVRTGRWAAVVPHTWLHVFGVPSGARAVPLTEPVRTMPVGLVTAAREPGSVMARALADVARHIDLAAALDRLPTELEI